MKTQVILLMLAAAGTALAQQEREERPQPPTAADFIVRLDTDSDGLIAANEFNGPEERFVRLDVNGDGFISEEEAPAGPPPGARRRRAREGDEVTDGTPGERPRAEGRRRGPPPNAAGRPRRPLEQDGDKVVSPDEFPGPVEHFEQLDQNGARRRQARGSDEINGSTPGERPRAEGRRRGPPPNAAGRPRRPLDQDGDGVVPPEEFPKRSNISNSSTKTVTDTAVKMSRRSVRRVVVTEDRMLPRP